MEFPRDINNLIVKKLDIDTRIKLGIITKLKKDSKFVEFTKQVISKLENKTKYDLYRFRDGFQQEISIVLDKYIFVKIFCFYQQQVTYNYVVHFEKSGKITSMLY
jgi:hypothetical protein